MNNQIIEVYLDDIIPNRFQPREKFNDQSINELASSIKKYGVIQPLVLRKIGDKFEIIAGERRYKASTLAGLEKVPAVIKNLNDSDSAEVALIENIQREDLTAIEKARSYDKLLKMSGETQEQLSKKLGISQSTLSNSIRLLALDDKVQDALLNRKISERHARSLLQISDKNKQREVLDKIINERMTVRSLDMFINEMNSGNQGGGQVITQPTPTESLAETLSAPAPIEISPVEPTPIPTFTPEVNVQPEPQIQEVGINTMEVPTENIGEKTEKPNFDMLLKTINDNEPVEVEPQVDFPNNIKVDLDNEVANMGVEEVTTIAPMPEVSIQPEITPEPVTPVAPTIEEKPNLVAPMPAPEPRVTIEPTAVTPVPREEERIEPTPIPSFTPEVTVQSAPVKEQAVVQTSQSKAASIRTAINTLRQSIETVEKYGFNINSDELDLENDYQFIITISKNNQ